MSGSIAFDEDKNVRQVWIVAGWAFRQALRDIAALNPADLEMTEQLKLAEDVGYLFVYKLEPQLSSRTAEAFRSGIPDLLSGKARSGIHDQPYGDARSVGQYHEALEDLLREAVRAFQEPDRHVT